MKKRDGPDSAAYAEELAEQGENLLQTREARRRGTDPARVPGHPPEEAARGLDDIPRPIAARRRPARAGEVRRGRAGPASQGYEGLKAREGQIPPLYARHHVAEAGRRIVRLYEAWGRPEKAAEWRAKLAGQGEAKHRP